MKTPMIEKPTVSEVIFEMIKLRAGDAIPAGWDERARAAIIHHTNERAALESVVSCAMIFIKRCEKGEIRSVKSQAMFRSAIADLAAVRAGQSVQSEAKVDHTPLVDALMSIASWPEGGEVDGSFDEPSAAQAARSALAKIGIVGGVK